MSEAKEFCIKNKFVNILCGGIHSQAVMDTHSKARVVNTCYKAEWDDVSDDDFERKMKVMKVLVKKFNQFRLAPNKRQCIKFDKISPYLKRFFMTESQDENVETGKPRWDISFEEISTVYPNAKELHFINNYRFNNAVLEGLIDHIRNGNRCMRKMGETEEVCRNNIEKIVFLYYDYKDSQMDVKSGKPIHHLMFQDPDKLNKKQLEQLKNLGWIIKQHKNGKSGYKIRVYKAKK